MGHILLKAMRHLVSKGVIEGIELDKLSQLQSCNSCEHANFTHNPISKIQEKPCASDFGEGMALDLWGPSVVQMPGKSEYYVLFTDNHMWWTQVELLPMKDEAFDPYTDFETWAKTQFRVRGFKRF